MYPTQIHEGALMQGVWKRHWIRLLGQGGERRQHRGFLLKGINHAIGCTEGVAKSFQRWKMSI